MKGLKFFFFTVLFCTVSMSIAGNDDFRKILAALYEEYHPPSISAAIIDESGKIRAACFGRKKLGEPEMVTLNDAYHIGSISKSFTAMLAAILVSEGRLGWDSKLIDIFPELPKAAMQRAERITLQDLLNHRAGIQPFVLPSEWKQVPRFKGPIPSQRMQFLAWCLSSTDHSSIGKFCYSNAGYDLAASMLEKVTGQSWETLIRHYVLNPIDLKSAGFGNPSENKRDGIWGHWQQWVGKSPTVPVASHQYALPLIERPSGDIHMSILDLARYARFCLAGLMGKPVSIEFGMSLNRQIFRTFFFSDPKYSCGWFRQRLQGQTVHIHWGSNGAFIAGIMLCKSMKFAAVVMANSSDPKSKRACLHYFERLLAGK